MGNRLQSLIPIKSAATSNCADLIINYLQQLGIDKVFGVPGGAIEPLCNSLARASKSSGPDYVVARHECGAAFMADGYYRETGKMGVVCVTTGPGTTNLITGVSSAMAEHTPLLVITAQTALPKFGKGALQESSCTAIDTVAMMRHCTLFTTLVSHPEQLESKLISAVMAAHRNPRGPVHISIPSDVLNSVISQPSRIHADLFTHDFEISDDRAIEILCKKINKVEAIAVFIDSGAQDDAEQVVKFCELVNAPFVVGPTGKYWVDETHRLYRGVYGFAGHESAREVFVEGQVDLILAVGAPLTELSTSGWDSALLNTKLVHIDSNAEHFSRSPMANHHVCSNVGAIFNKVTAFVKKRLLEGKRWTLCNVSQERNSLGTYAKLDHAPAVRGRNKISAASLASILADKLPEKTRVFLDAGNTWAWMTHYYVNRNYNGHVHTGMAFGSMAWSPAAAIGAAVTNPRNLSVAILGDGAYLMSAQELTVAVQLKLPVIFIVLNDSALGMVKHGQQLGGAESIGWELCSVNYAMQATSMGATGIVIESMSKLEELDFHLIQSLGAPVLLDVRIDQNEKPPIGQRVKGLKQ